MDKVLNVYFKVLDDITIPIFHTLRKSRYANIKCWFCKDDVQQAIYYARDLKTIEYNSTNLNLVCFHWNIDDFTLTPEYSGLAHLMERILTQHLEFVCIDNVKHAKQQLVLFQDARHILDYPKEFVKVPCFNIYDDLIVYAQNHGIFDFTLDNPNRFEKCPGISPIQGACVYRERSTNHYWYRDMLHKTHYEMFDKCGHRHLGEADMNGVLDTTKKDVTKHPIF